MRQGSRTSLITALSGLLLVLAGEHNIPQPTILAVGLPMRAIGSGSSGLVTVAMSLVRITLAASWAAVLLFESRRYWLSWMFSQHLAKPFFKSGRGSQKES